MIGEVFETAAVRGEAFAFVEILTICPTGWFVDAHDAPDYLAENLAEVHTIGVLKRPETPSEGGAPRPAQPGDPRP